MSRERKALKWSELRIWGAAVLSPHKFGGGRFGVGEVEFKPRDLGSDRGYRVAIFRWWTSDRCLGWATPGGASPAPTNIEEQRIVCVSGEY
jgi:hypothetical protein